METGVIDGVLSVVFNISKGLFEMLDGVISSTIPLSTSLSILLFSLGIGFLFSYLFRSDNKILSTSIFTILLFTILGLVSGGI